MSVATKNPFALLDDDAPPEPVAQKKEDAPPPPPLLAALAAVLPPEAESTTPVAVESPPGILPRPMSQHLKTKGNVGIPLTPSPHSPSHPSPSKSVDGPREGRGRGRGGRGGPGRGRGRPFDKHSQTGKVDSDKKIHQSWGGDDGNAELKAETAAVGDAAAEDTAGNEWGTPAAAASDWDTPAVDVDAWASATPADAVPGDGETKPEGRPRREREPEEEDNTLTFDQYIAQQKDKDTIIPKLEGTRQVDADWKDVVPLAKNEEEDAYFVGKTKSAPKARAKKEEKVYLEIDARFDRPDRGGRGRGRGGDRGGDRARGRGRGAPRGGRQPTNQVINVDDQNAFPSLS